MDKLSAVMSKTPLLSGGEVSEIMVKNGLVYHGRASTSALSQLLYCSHRSAQRVIKDGFKEEGSQALFYLQMKMANPDKYNQKEN